MPRSAWPIILARIGALRCSSDEKRDPAVRKALERPLLGQELQRHGEDAHRVQEGRRAINRQADEQEARDAQASAAQRALRRLDAALAVPPERRAAAAAASWPATMARLNLARGAKPPSAAKA
jgi:hypothetical protein